MKELAIVEHKGSRILTTAQVADFLETDVKHINDNFQNNREQYTQGEDYFFLDGKELKSFIILYPELFGVQNTSKIRSLYLWTEFGVMMHVKSLDTKMAWKAYKTLLRDYFRLVKEASQHHQEAINAAFRIRRDENRWLVEKMRFTVDEKTDVIALQGILRDLNFADNAFLDTSLGKLFYPWCEQQGYDMSLVKQTEKVRLVIWKLKSDGSYDLMRPIRMKVHSYPEDPFGLAWTKFLVEYYWPIKFLPYIKNKYKGEERAKNIEAGMNVIGFYTGLPVSQITERKSA